MSKTSLLVAAALVVATTSPLLAQSRDRSSTLRNGATVGSVNRPAPPRMAPGLIEGRNVAIDPYFDPFAGDRAYRAWVDHGSENFEGGGQ
jgi:hypothetical protein